MIKMDREDYEMDEEDKEIEEILGIEERKDYDLNEVKEKKKKIIVNRVCFGTGVLTAISDLIVNYTLLSNFTENFIPYNSIPGHLILWKEGERWGKYYSAGNLLTFIGGMCIKNRSAIERVIGDYFL